MAVETQALTGAPWAWRVEDDIAYSCWSVLQARALAEQVAQMRARVVEGLLRSHAQDLGSQPTRRWQALDRALGGLKRRLEQHPVAHARSRREQAVLWRILEARTGWRKGGQVRVSVVAGPADVQWLELADIDLRAGASALAAAADPALTPEQALTRRHLPVSLVLRCRDPRAPTARVTFEFSSWTELGDEFATQAPGPPAEAMSGPELARELAVAVQGVPYRAQTCSASLVQLARSALDSWARTDAAIAAWTQSSVRPGPYRLVMRTAGALQLTVLDPAGKVVSTPFVMGRLAAELGEPLQRAGARPGDARLRELTLHLVVAIVQRQIHQLKRELELEPPTWRLRVLPAQRPHLVLTARAMPCAYLALVDIGTPPTTPKTRSQGPAPQASELLESLTGLDKAELLLDLPHYDWRQPSREALLRWAAEVFRAGGIDLVDALASAQGEVFHELHFTVAEFYSRLEPRQ